jgi:hypothetical protein
VAPALLGHVPALSIANDDLRLAPVFRDGSGCAHSARRREIPHRGSVVTSDQDREDLIRIWLVEIDEGRRAAAAGSGPPFTDSRSVIW